MMRRNPRPDLRRGHTVVESALVLSIFLMFLVAIFEYCRFVYVDQMITNAAREGARYAVVNTTDTNLVADTTTQVSQRMGGADNQLNPYSVSVFLSDASGNNLGSPVNAAFGQYIAVKITGTYNPVVPSFLFMGTPQISAISLMYSEGN
jgi:Flp pilus assembly protein TadG